MGVFRPLLSEKVTFSYVKGDNMVTEIAIMNKEAIAIAADSAVTLREQKVFTSANKIFTLSKYHPVGIMIYGSANFMEVPWETIIKIYRSKLGS